MYYSAEALADMRREFATVRPKQLALQQRYLTHAFAQERAREFAHHGFARRLKTLARCIENVFDLIPIEQVAPVDSRTRNDAEINIQASVFNVFAAADNLAWIWVLERGVRQANGADLPDTWVGLRQGNRAVREALPADLRNSVQQFDQWFDMVDNYRHALAHRIPLYIPPFGVDSANERAYQQLEVSKHEALARGDRAEHDRMRAEQAALEFFRPWMIHSLGEGARPLVFHPQLLANFNTVEELGRLLINALDAN